MKDNQIKSLYNLMRLKCPHCDTGKLSHVKKKEPQLIKGKAHYTYCCSCRDCSKITYLEVSKELATRNILLNESFPLFPLLKIREANNHNTKGFTLSWGFLSVWTLDSFGFEFSIVADPSHWGVGITAIIPYLRIVLTIPTNNGIRKVFEYIGRGF